MLWGRGAHFGVPVAQHRRHALQQPALPAARQGHAELPAVRATKEMRCGWSGHWVHHLFGAAELQAGRRAIQDL